MLHVGTSADDDADLVVFVDRIAAAGSDPVTAAAAERIRTLLTGGDTPPGVRMLAQALAASMAERPPEPRRPAEDTVVTAARGSSFVVLDAFDVDATAAAVAALATDGRRVVVTAETPAELATVAAALPPGLSGRTVDALPGLSPADVRELRRLLAVSTPPRRARAEQQLPDTDLLPAPAEVARLCADAARPTRFAGSAASVLAPVLAGLDPRRRAAVTSVARLAQQSLAGLPSPARVPWVRPLLGELVHHRYRPGFDQLREDITQAVAALDRARDLPPVVISGALPPGSLDALRRYADHLDVGGRARLALRRPSAQREVLPALRLLRVAGRMPETGAEVRRAVDHIELAERLAAVDAGCAEVGLPAPRSEAELRRTADALGRVAAAARSVGALRHDVLFLAEGSPLPVPDLDAAQQIAAVIVDYAENGSAVEASRRLDLLAEAVAEAVPVVARSPEHEAAVHALLRRDPHAYAAAVDALGAARCEITDERRRARLLAALAADAPALAAEWARPEPGERRGLVCLRPAGALLSELPPPDSADVVLVLGAHRLGVERLLLTAVAPRLVAAVPPAAEPEASPTMLSVLARAAALVLHAEPAPIARIVPMPRPKPAPVSRAGS